MTGLKVSVKGFEYRYGLSNKNWARRIPIAVKILKIFWISMLATPSTRKEAKRKKNCLSP
jgi:hypothetical protein